jgi:hypothetical protein
MARITIEPRALIACTRSGIPLLWPVGSVTRGPSRVGDTITRRKPVRSAAGCPVGDQLCRPPGADASVLASTNTSVLPSTNIDSPPAAATYLSDMLPLDNQNVASVYGTYPTSIDGEPHAKSVILKTDMQGPQSLEYVLSGQFKAFSAVLGVQDLAGEPHGPVVCHWRVLVDNREIVVGDSQRGVHINTGSVEISGGVHLKIEVTATSGSGYPGDYAPCTAGDALLS